LLQRLKIFAASFFERGHEIRQRRVAEAMAVEIDLDPALKTARVQIEVELFDERGPLAVGNPVEIRESIVG
jgi:hypothetical protein